MEPVTISLEAPILTVPHSFLTDTKGKLKLQFKGLEGIPKTGLTARLEVDLLNIPNYVKNFFIVYTLELNQSVGICRTCLQNKAGLWPADLQTCLSKEKDVPTLGKRLQSYVKELKVQYIQLYPIFAKIFAKQPDKELIKVVARVAQKKLMWEMANTTGSSVIKVSRNETKSFPWSKFPQEGLFIHFPIRIASGGFKIIYESMEYTRGLHSVRLTKKKNPNILATTVEEAKKELKRLWKNEIETLREIKKAQDEGLDTEGIIQVYAVGTYINEEGKVKDIVHLKRGNKDLFDYLLETPDKPEVKLQLAYYIIKGILNFQRITDRIHRDITLGNFLIHFDHNYKESNPAFPVTALCDFGPAHKRGTAVKACNFGTPGFISPELIKKFLGEGKITEKDLETSEAYALGIVLWILYYEVDIYWAGYQVNGKWITCLKQMELWEQGVQPKRGSMTGVKAIIYRLLTFDPAHRMSISEALQALTQVIQSNDASLGFPKLEPLEKK